jgi:hypothetical protein
MADIISWESIRKRLDLESKDYFWVFDILEIFEEVFNENKAKYVKTSAHQSRTPERYHMRVAHDLKLKSDKLINIVNYKTTPSLHELIMYDKYWNGEITKRILKRQNNILSISLAKKLKKAKSVNINHDTNANLKQYSEQDQLFS